MTNLSLTAVVQSRETLYNERQESSEALTAVPSNPPLNLWLPPLVPAIHTNPSHRSPSPIHALPLLPWTLFPWHKRILSDVDSVLMEAGRRLFFFSFFFWGGLFVGRLSGVNAKAHLCVEEWGSAINTEFFTHQPVLINSASGALT